LSRWLDTLRAREYNRLMPSTQTKHRITHQRATILAVLGMRQALGLQTCAADLTRIVWGGRGHAATYAVVDRMARVGLIKCQRSGSRVLLAIA